MICSSVTPATTSIVDSNSGVKTGVVDFLNDMVCSSRMILVSAQRITRPPPARKPQRTRVDLYDRVVRPREIRGAAWSKFLQGVHVKYATTEATYIQRICSRTEQCERHSVEGQHHAGFNAQLPQAQERTLQREGQ